jgi:hypothetical protein
MVVTIFRVGIVLNRVADSLSAITPIALIAFPVRLSAAQILPGRGRAVELAPLLAPLGDTKPDRKLLRADVASISRHEHSHGTS